MNVMYEMFSDTQFYLISAFAIAYSIFLMMAALLIRFFNRNKPVPVAGERRQRLLLRRTLNVLILVSFGILIVLFCAGIAGMWGHIEASDVTSSPLFYIIAAFTVAYPLFLMTTVLLIRFFNKNKQLPEGEERRQRPVLRRVLNMLVLVPIGVLVSMAVVGGVDEYNGMTLSSPFYVVVALVTASSILLIGAMFFLFKKKKNQRPPSP